MHRYVLLAALMRSPGAPARGVERALEFIRKRVDAEGAIGRDGDLIEYPNYATAYAVRCLMRRGNTDDRKLIRRMRGYLRSQQYQEGSGFERESPAYGGWGFGGRLPRGHAGHMDLSHVRAVLQALGPTDRAQVFLRRVQNEDGGFFFSPVALPANKGRGKGSYATATCDGVLALADPKAAMAIGAGVAVGLRRHAEAVVLFRRFLKDHPDNPRAHYLLGTSLRHVGEYEDSITHLRKSLDLEPDQWFTAMAQCNLGQSLNHVGRWSKAEKEVRKGHELGQKLPGWSFQSARWLAETTRMLALEPRLDKLLRGEGIEVTPLERVLLAKMAMAKKRHAEAVASYLHAFRENPMLEPAHVDWAIGTAIAGGAPHRARAIRWFRAWLARLRTMLGSNPEVVAHQIFYWKQSPWYTAARDGDIHAEWKKFWADANALQEQARKKLKR